VGGVGGLLLLGLAFFFYRRFKRSRRHAHSELGSNEPIAQDDMQHYRDDYSMSNMDSQPKELHSNDTNELAGVPVGAELPTKEGPTRNAHELE
jgi:septal ring-binding cell division protein DamX